MIHGHHNAGCRRAAKESRLAYAPSTTINSGFRVRSSYLTNLAGSLSLVRNR